MQTAIGGGRLASIEVLEHGLQAARDEYEERKLRHLAALLAFLFFNPELSAADAHHYLALAERLTYRQLVLIAIFADEATVATFPDEDLVDSDWILGRDIGLLRELAELAADAVLFHRDLHISSFNNINLVRMNVRLQGRVLYEGMKLDSVDADAHASVEAELQAFAHAYIRSSKP